MLFWEQSRAAIGSAAVPRDQQPGASQYCHLAGHFLNLLRCPKALKSWI